MATMSRQRKNVVVTLSVAMAIALLVGIILMSTRVDIGPGYDPIACGTGWSGMANQGLTDRLEDECASAVSGRRTAGWILLGLGTLGLLAVILVSVSAPDSAEKRTTGVGRSAPGEDPEP